MTKKILLTFDLEEFDLPNEYKINIDTETQLKITSAGLAAILLLLKKYNIKATFFTTAFYAENRPLLIKEIAQAGHEIASHLYYHSTYNNDDLLKSKLVLEQISNLPIYGFRSPRLKQFSLKEIKHAGYLYDSSLNPTFIPGRYNNLSKPKLLFKDAETELLIMPISVATFFRFPLFWLSFKNLNFKLYTYLCKKTLHKNGVLHLYFHPWEFSDLDNFKIPKYIKRKSGELLLVRLEKFILKFKSTGDFCSVITYINKETITNSIFSI